MSYEVKNEQLVKWVAEVAALCGPEKIHWCDGSQEEYDTLCNQLVEGDQQLDAPQRDEGYIEQAFQGLHAWPHHVRHPFQHGATRLTNR